MTMWLRLLLLCFCFLLPVSLAVCQQPAGNQEGWRRLRSIDAGSRLELKTNHGKTKCRLIAVMDEQIQCENAAIPRAEVQQVRLVQHGRSTAKGLLVGAGVGVGVGAVVGAALGRSAFSTPGKGAAVGIAIFTPIGAAIGALTGLAGGTSAVTVYQR